MNKLAEEIVAIFPTENKEIYYISRKDARKTNASGILYNRFNNLNRKRIRLDSNTSEEQNASERETLCSTNYISFKNKMYFMSGDESDAINLWSETYKYRVNHIRDLKDLTSILEEWPFYKQATGPKFLDFDFQKMYPDENFHLINNWTDMRNQLGQLYKDLLRDKQYVDLFGSVSNECVNDNSKDCILIMLLNAVLKPTSRYVAEIDGKRVTSKTTIRDAMDSCIVHITNINDLEFTYAEKVKKSMHRKEKIQPYLIVVGSDIKSLTEFYVNYGGALQKFHSFIAALDICFKVFHVLNLEYPRESSLMWYFLQKQIYKITTVYDIKSSALCEFLTLFKS
ncbi:uncharacterized protein LOC118743286 [Rhagoletis pomonella]|uniref:uncharacterized protein LOC118743286 n=1 Tax=Rhagoletis pomonella TaxID=28610 RepID=UPI001785022E|nr:uncharacterized protein LOC118743286 [Rhagoletis pomonella]